MKGKKKNKKSKSIRIGETERKILKYLRYKINMKKEKQIRKKILKEGSIQSSLDSLKNKGLISMKNISEFYGGVPIKHYSISKDGENIVKK